MLEFPSCPARALTQEEAIRGIDVNAIPLRAGVTLLVSIARRSGMFEYFAIWSAQ